MSLKNPDQVKDISNAIEKITREDLKKGYNQISPNDNDYADFFSDEV